MGYVPLFCGACPDLPFNKISMIGPSSAMGASRRGMGSGHHVGKIDDRIGIGDFPDERGNDPEPLVSVLERR